MTSEHTAERDAIKAAAARLLVGTPVRSTGALTVVALAEEADVKRHVLTHRHTDLKEPKSVPGARFPTASGGSEKNSTRPDAAWPKPTSRSNLWRTTTKRSPAS